MLPAGQLLPATLTVRKLEVLLRSQGHHEVVPAILIVRELVVLLRCQGHHEMVPAILSVRELVLLIECSLQQLGCCEPHSGTSKLLVQFRVWCCIVLAVA